MILISKVSVVDSNQSCRMCEFDDETILRQHGQRVSAYSLGDPLGMGGDSTQEERING